MKLRHRNFWQAAAIFLIMTMLFNLNASATRSQLDAVADTIEQLKEGQEESQQELDSLQADKAVLNGRLQQLNQDLSVLATDLTSLEEELARTEEEIILTGQQLAEARTEEETQYENMKKRIRFFYEKGDASLLEALLQAGSFADFVNQAEYIQNIHAYDREMLTEYQRVTEEIAAKEQELEMQQQEVMALTEAQKEKIDQAEELLAEVKANLDATNQKIDDAESQLAEYEERLQEQLAYEAELEAQKAAEEAKIQEETDGQEPEALPPYVPSGNESDIALLAAIIECEAGNQSYEGMLAVGSVVINRVRSSLFPNTVLEVLYQKGQFTPVASGRFAETLSRGAMPICVQAATEVLGGNITIDKLFFRTNNGSVSGIVIGAIVFY